MKREKKLLNDYNKKTSKELSEILNHYKWNVRDDSFSIIKMTVEIQESMSSDYRISYTPVVSLKYKFRSLEPGSNR